MKRTGKRIGSIFLAMCMAFTLLPMGALAAEVTIGINYMSGTDTRLNAMGGNASFLLFANGFCETAQLGAFIGDETTPAFLSDLYINDPEQLTIYPNITFTFPANTSLTEDKVYTVKARLNGGAWDEIHTVTVTVEKSSGTPIAQKPQFTYSLISSMTLNVGDTLTMTLQVESPDGGSLTYQWYKSVDAAESVMIGGATNATFTISNVTTTDTGDYYAKVTNNKEGYESSYALSNICAVTVKGIPTVSVTPYITINPPQTNTQDIGGTLTLTVEAIAPDGGTLSFQWYKAADATSPGAAIPGATGQTYTKTGLAASDAGFYYATITNRNSPLPSASVTSWRCQVIVSQPAVPTITTIGLYPTFLSAEGGSTTITVTGSNLANGIKVTAFDGTTATSITGTTTGSLVEQKVTLTFPPNTSTAAAKAYTIKASLNNGATWDVKNASFFVESAIPPHLDFPTDLNWVTAFPGKATWNAVANAGSYLVQLYKDGVEQGAPIPVHPSLTVFDFTTVIAASGAGSYTFTVVAKGDGINYSDSAESNRSAAYRYTDVFVPVSGITLAGDLTVFAGIDRELIGTVTPTNATKKTIEWSIEPDDLNTAGATILPNGTTLRTVTEGTVTVTATIVGGKAESGTDEQKNSVQKFPITVLKPEADVLSIYIWMDYGAENTPTPIDATQNQSKTTGFSKGGWDWDATTHTMTIRDGSVFEGITINFGTESITGRSEPTVTVVIGGTVNMKGGVLACPFGLIVKGAPGVDATLSFFHTGYDIINKRMQGIDRPFITSTASGNITIDGLTINMENDLAVYDADQNASDFDAGIKSIATNKSAQLIIQNGATINIKNVQRGVVTDNVKIMDGSTLNYIKRGDVVIDATGNVEIVGSTLQTAVAPTIGIARKGINAGGNVTISDGSRVELKTFENAAIDNYIGIRAGGDLSIQSSIVGVNAGMTGLYIDGSITIGGGSRVDAQTTNGSSSTSTSYPIYGAGLTVEDGTVYAKGSPLSQGGIFCIDSTKYIVQGGSVHSSPIAQQPSLSANPLYLVTLSGMPANKKVTDMSEPAGYGWNGMETDRNGMLYLWLPVQSGLSIALNMNDVEYRGTINVTDDNQAMLTIPKVPSVISSVTVFPSTATLVQGGTQRFTVAVAGTNAPAQTVTWHIAGATDAATSITSDGLLTVSANETSQSLTVTAISSEDSTKLDMASVTVTIHAKMPQILTQPIGEDYSHGDIPVPLSVLAAVSDGGTLSYQWHEEAGTSSTPIVGATGVDFTPPTDMVGTRYYYVVVTNTNSNANGLKTNVNRSDTATVTVNKKALTSIKQTMYVKAGLAESHNYTFDLTKLMPSGADASKITSYSIAFNGSDGSESILASSSISDSTLTVSVKANAAAGAQESLVIDFVSDYYTVSRGFVTFIATDKTPVAVSGVTVLSRDYNGDTASPVGTALFTNLTTGTPVLDLIPVYTWAKTVSMDDPTLPAAPSKLGYYTLTVSADGSTDYTIIPLTVYFELSKIGQKITWNQDIATATVGDAETTLDAAAESNLAISYTSSNIAVAAISGNKLAIVGPGTAVITASQTGDEIYNAAASVEKVITVSAAPPATPVTGVSLNKSTLLLYSNTMPSTATLTATVTPSNATDKKVTWSSGNNVVATVDQSGNITAVGNGTAVILATTIDGSHTASCTVTVTTYSGGNDSGNSPPPSTGIPVGDLSDDGKSNVTIYGSAGTVILPSNMLSNLDAPKDAKAEVKITAVHPDNLTVQAQAIIGNRPIVSINLLINGKVTEWNNLNAPVTVSIPYVPTAEELSNPEGITAYYINSNGNLIEMVGAKYDSKTLCVVFQTTHFSYYAVGYKSVAAPTLQFDDVLSGAWYYDAVSFCAEKGITNGTSETTFSPDATLTRGQFITMLFKAYDIEPDTNQTDNFADAGSTYYTGYLAAAKAKGISNGLGDNKFGPENAITRQEMFTLLYNALRVLDKLPTSDNGKTLADFTDGDSVASWANEAMTVLVKSGDVSGSEGRLNPAATATRAQMAQMLYNLLGK